MLKAKVQKEESKARAGELPSLSRKEFAILAILIDSRQELYGLEMVDASKGELKRGTVYVTLQRMQEKGLVDSRPEPRISPEIGIPRRLYIVTGYGQRVFKAYSAAYLLMMPDSAAAG